MKEFVRRSVAGIAFLMFGALNTACSISPGLRLDVPDADCSSGSAASEPCSRNIATADGNYSIVKVSPAVLKSLASQTSTNLALPVEVARDPAEQYQVGAGDILSITVFDHPELSASSLLSGGGGTTAPLAGVTQAVGFLVNADGTVAYPYIGAVKVAGKTTAQIQAQITDGLRKLYRNPQVDVRVGSFRSKRIEVGGEVLAPGIVTLDDLPKTILDAVNERGGLKASSSHRRILLTRNGTTYELSPSQSLQRNTGVFSLAQPGDFIYIPAATADQVFVLGEVARSAPIVMQNDRVSLTEALTTSGGLDRLTSKGSGVMVFRRAEQSGKLHPVIYTLDLSRPEGLLLAGEFTLQPSDVVYVEATDFAKYNSIIAQLLPTVATLFESSVVIRATR